MNILIVEDMRVMAQSLRRQLAVMGHTDVTVATSAEEALEKLREDSFDVILLDWMLPEMSGLELLRTLRGTRRYAQTPIMMMTANDDRSDVIEAFRVGATDYIVKPYLPEVLEEKMVALVKKHAERG